MLHFSDEIRIGNRIIDRDAKTFIIGEAGVNHNGNIDTAKKLIDCAVTAGVDAVKFQMFRTDDLILQNVGKAPYQNKTTDQEQSQYEMLKSLELKKEAYIDLMKYARDAGITFLCTPFEETSLNELDEMGLDAFKIAATDLTNIQFLRKVAQKKKPILLSAGMCYLEEIRMVLEAIHPYNHDVVLMQCSANYPLRNEEVNLNVIDTLIREFDIIVGYSDHSVGVGAAPYAVAKGAKVIEKHFTLDRDGDGPDQRASVEPNELGEMVRTIRVVEKYLGSGIKIPTVSEQNTRKALQKSLVASRSIKRGELFSEINITAKRTGGKGVSALYFDCIEGRKANRDYQKDECIQDE